MYDDPVVHVYILKDAGQGDDQSATIYIPEVNTLKAWTLNEYLHVSGLTYSKPWSIYTIGGKLIHHAIANSNEVSVKLPERGIYIVTSDSRTVKVIF